MAAYVGVVCLTRQISIIINFWDIFGIPSPFFEPLELAEHALKSYRNFVESLDSRSRKRMNASLERITEALQKHCQYFTPTILCEVEYEDFSRLVHSLVEELKEVKEEFYTLPEDDEEQVHIVSSTSCSRVFSKSKMVGLYDQRRQLKNHVMMDPYYENNLNAGSVIVGMAGIGKTTLALDIFEDLDVSEWFDCRAWVEAGNLRKPEEIAEAIIAQVAGGSKSKRLKEILKRKRFLIVLDGVCSDNVHEYLVNCSIPYVNENGSRLLVTTRMKPVGDPFPIYLFDVRLLSKEESWDLLREKVFAGDSCPPHLQDSGKKIAEKCDGLPLTIVTVANLLSKVEKSIWIDVAADKKHQLFIDAYDQISKVMVTTRSKL